MPDRHAPDREFVDNLEWQIRGELRRRERRGAPASRGWQVLRTVAVAVVSVAFGAAAVTAQQRLQESWRTEILVERLEIQQELAARRAALLREELQDAQRRQEIGVDDWRPAAQAELALAEVEGELRIVELRLEEARLSGREPDDGISAPVVAGRDFVSERLRVRAELIQRHRELARRELEAHRRREAAGTVDSMTVAVVERSVEEIDGQLLLIAERLQIRRQFVEGELSAVEAELRVMQHEAERRAEALRGRQDEAQERLDQVQRRIDIGVVEPAMARQLEMELAEIEAQLRLAALEREVLEREARQRQR